MDKLKIEANGVFLEAEEDDDVLYIKSSEVGYPVFTFNKTPGGISQAENLAITLMEWVDKNK